MNIQVLVPNDIPEDFALSVALITSGEGGYKEWQDVDKYPREQIYPWMEELFRLNRIPHGEFFLDYFRIRMSTKDN